MGSGYQTKKCGLSSTSQMLICAESKQTLKNNQYIGIIDFKKETQTIDNMFRPRYRQYYTVFVVYINKYKCLLSRSNTYILG